MKTHRQFHKQEGTAIAVLSEKFITDPSRPVAFPDFTKGKGKTTPPIRIMGV